MRTFAVSRIHNMPVDEQRRAEVAKLLVSLLSDSDTLVRSSAVSALQKWWTPESLPTLLALADDQDFAVRWKAIEALAATKTPEAAKAIAGRLGQDRLTAAKALASMGPVAEPPALALLASKNDDVRSEACDVLRAVGTKKSLTRLKSLARDKNRLVGMAAQQAVEAIQGRK